MVNLKSNNKYSDGDQYHPRLLENLAMSVGTYHLHFYTLTNEKNEQGNSPFS